jgi:hypothetical protein
MWNGRGATTVKRRAQKRLLSARCRALISRAEMLVAGANQEPRESASGLLELLKGGSHGRRAPESRSQMSKRKRAGDAGRRPGASSTTLSQLTIDAMADELNHRPRRTHG